MTKPFEDDTLYTRRQIAEITLLPMYFLKRIFTLKHPNIVGKRPIAIAGEHLNLLFGAVVGVINTFGTLFYVKLSCGHAALSYSRNVGICGECHKEIELPKRLLIAKAQW